MSWEMWIIYTLSNSWDSQLTRQYLTTISLWFLQDAQIAAHSHLRGHSADVSPQGDDITQQFTPWQDARVLLICFHIWNIAFGLFVEMERFNLTALDEMLEWQAAKKLKQWIRNLILKKGNERKVCSSKLPHMRLSELCKVENDILSKE